MRTGNFRSWALLLAAGSLQQAGAATHEPRQPRLSHRTAEPILTGHIYYNPATGERVITPYGQGPRSVSNPVWISNNTDPCATGGTVGVMDDPDLDGDGRGDLFGVDCETGTFPCEGSWNLWWGDIRNDTVVDCVVTSYGTYVPTLDEDEDHLSDPVVGFDLFLSFHDNDAGFGSDFAGESGRSCIIELAIPTLPGMVISILPPGGAAVYKLTIDLADTSTSLIFELGDSDGIDDAGTGLSGGAIYGHPTGNDIDGDGLADFSYGLRFDQSALGTSGAPGVTKGVTGFISSAAKLGNPGDLPPHPADATGLFDSMDIYSSGPSCPPLTTHYIGTYHFGGFTCEPGAEIPSSSAYLELYGPGANLVCNEADLAAPRGTLDFSDVLAFLAAFGQGLPGGEAADLSEPLGVLNFSDVLAFLTAFGEGCP